ncbi:MAG: LuxR C-terminal-related transcriptional regulator [Treponema sp.]|jgi:DNA-binding NarL/FixJ family response regulator|nr:LuxR C-terminal-related transcriptional regulator [Treponema sp.]
MPGGTLVLSREKKLYPLFRTRLAELGFTNFEITGEERDSLNFIINEKKPRLVLVGSGFYECSTAYMMGKLLRTFPKLNIAAVSVFYKIPDDLGAWFIYNGVKSYINFLEGPDEFYGGLIKVREGKEYISPGVVERMNMRREMAEPAGNITDRQMEIIRLLCNGFTGHEICDVLAIADDTLSVQKTKIYTCLNVRNEKELIRVALFLKWITVEELCFFGREYILNPQPMKPVNKSTRRIAVKSIRLAPA